MTLLPASRALAATLLGAFAVAAAAQSYPAKPVRIVVPFPPGQSADTMMRILAEQLGPVMGQQFVVENRPGAGGVIGTEYVAKQPPDGYTLLMAASGTFAISPSLQAKLPYDPLKDFEPVTAVAGVAQAFVVNPAFPAKSIADLIRLAKEKPGALAYGSSGNGTTQHLMVEQFASMAGIKLLHVPYKGSSPALTDLMSGQIPFLSDTIPAVRPLIQAGKVRPIAVTSIKRQPFLPEVPTLDEQGVKGYDAVGWIAVAAPAGTPAPILDRLAAEIQKIVAAPATKKRFDDFGFVAMTEQRSQFTDFVKSELVKWRKVVQDSGAKAE